MFLPEADVSERQKGCFHRRYQSSGTIVGMEVLLLYACYGRLRLGSPMDRGVFHQQRKAVGGETVVAGEYVGISNLELVECCGESVVSE